MYMYNEILLDEKNFFKWICHYYKNFQARKI